MKLKENIKIREEDGFFLLINLNEESILKGYPSFFRINTMAKEIIDYMRSDVTIEDILLLCCNKSSFYCDKRDEIIASINYLRRADLTCE